MCAKINLHAPTITANLHILKLFTYAGAHRHALTIIQITQLSDYSEGARNLRFCYNQQFYYSLLKKNNTFLNKRKPDICGQLVKSTLKNK